MLQTEIPLYLKEGSKSKPVQLKTIRGAQLEFSPSDNGLDLQTSINSRYWIG